MNWKASIVCALFFASALISRAAPVTYKEIAMLVRNGEHEQFIFGEAEKRKLLQTLSKQEEAALASLGSTPALLNALRSPALLAPPDMVAAYQARLRKQEEDRLALQAPRAILVATPRPVAAVPNVVDGVTRAKNAAPALLMQNDAYSLAQLDDAKAKARAEGKPLGFIMVWGEFFGKRADPRFKGSLASFIHFQRAFENTLILVYVRHESELSLAPDAVKKGFLGPDEGGFAPNMAVADASASELIVEVPMGGNEADGYKRDEIFTTAAGKIDQWLARHPGAISSPPAPAKP